MPYLAQVTLVGHAGGDAKQKVSESGSVRTEFTVSYSKKYKDQERTIWFTCTAFGKTGEYCLTKVKKGDAIAVIGDIDDISAYARKQDGQPTASTRVVVNKLLWLRSSTKSSDAPVTEVPVYDNQFNSTIPVGATDDTDIPF